MQPTKLSHLFHQKKNDGNRKSIPHQYRTRSSNATFKNKIKN
jgi:hypothetical protein